MKPVTQYHAFLIRTWIEETQEEQSWRYRVQNVQSGEQHGFVSLMDLFNFLKDELDEYADLTIESGKANES